MLLSRKCKTRTTRRNSSPRPCRRWQKDDKSPQLRETRGQIERLEQAFQSLDEKIKGKHCDDIAGIIEEGSSVMGEDFEDVTMDACLIASGQRAEHYEMAA